MIDKNVEVGRYIVLEFLATDAPYFSPRGKITKISGNRVYFMNKHNEDEHFVSMKSIYAVCDTIEECEMLREFTQNCLKEVWDLKKTHQKMVNQLFTKKENKNVDGIS